MARIRYSYNYMVYPKSPEATKYSRKLAKRQAMGSGVLYATLLAVAFAFAVIIVAAYADIIGLATLLLLPAAIGGGIWLGLFINRRINDCLEKKIYAAIERDGVQLTRNDAATKPIFRDVD